MTQIALKDPPVLTQQEAVTATALFEAGLDGASVVLNEAMKNEGVTFLRDLSVRLAPHAEAAWETLDPDTKDVDVWDADFIPAWANAVLDPFHFDNISKVREAEFLRKRVEALK